MYFYRTNEILNRATDNKPVILKDIANNKELLDLYTRSVRFLEQGGDITHEDVRLVKDEVLRRMENTQESSGYG